jgi:CDP-4-dehydro-6-deoxyglucose reductase
MSRLISAVVNCPVRNGRWPECLYPALSFTKTNTKAKPMAAYTVTFEPSGTRLECTGEASILETALAAGYFPRHSCRRGECLACEARVVSGSVAYPGGSTPEGVSEGACLTCLAYPVSDVVLDATEVAATPGRRTLKTGARVVSVERVSRDVAVVRLQLPAASGFRFTAGQYMDVVMRDGTRRSYSMANRPDEDGSIEWHIRAMPAGRFSQHVYLNLKTRDLLRVEGPFGSFMLRESGRPVIFLATGTGYAPIAALMRTHGEALAARGASFYWGGARQADLYALEEAKAWAQQSTRFRFVPVLSDPDAHWIGRRGFVHDAVSADFPDLSGFEVYACGNPLMVDAARASFTTANSLSHDDFISDAFVTASVSRASDY